MARHGLANLRGWLLTSLNMPSLGDAFGDGGAIALAESMNVVNLLWISLNGNGISERGVDALAASCVS